MSPTTRQNAGIFCMAYVPKMVKVNKKLLSHEIAYSNIRCNKINVPSSLKYKYDKTIASF